MHVIPVRPEWERQGWVNELAWLLGGVCGRCHDVWDDERGVPIASVGETPVNATRAMTKNLQNARRLIRKPLCAECQSKLRRKPGGSNLIVFAVSVP